MLRIRWTCWPKARRPSAAITISIWTITENFRSTLCRRITKRRSAKFSKAKLEASGVLPWQIGVYSQKLTAAMRNHDWEEARLDAATLAAYVAQAHDPFHTTENFDGHLSEPDGSGFQIRVESGRPVFHVFPDAAQRREFFCATPPTMRLTHCMSAHASLESILLADRRAREGLSDFTDDYYDRFYNLTGAILIRQLSDAASDVGSYWLTAWINAGRPQLPPQ